MKPPVIILTGPTAVGKTALSIQLAKAIGGIMRAVPCRFTGIWILALQRSQKKKWKEFPDYLIDVLEPWEEF